MNNNSNRSVLSIDTGGGAEQRGGGGLAGGGSGVLNTMQEQRGYPRTSSLPSPRRTEREYLHDSPVGGGSGGGGMMSHTTTTSMPDDMIKHRERERMIGGSYHSSPYHSSLFPTSDRDDAIKYRERERMMTMGGDGYPYQSSPPRYESHWEDRPVPDMHDYSSRDGSYYSDPYGDTRGHFHQGQYDNREDAIRRKHATYNAGRATHEKMIEVAPGFQVRLRGADETWAAVERDFFGPASCFSCDSTVFCILDAEYVLCPTCKVVFPFEQDGVTSDKSKTGAGGGVGLGFSMEDLARFQADIVSRHS